jgi:ankyrin repeat protein
MSTGSISAAEIMDEYMDEEEADAIFTAVVHGDVEAVAWLLDIEPHLIEAIDPHQYGRTPLVAAAEEGHVAVVTLLIERGGDINASNAYHLTALDRAAVEGHEEVVNLLLSCGADCSKKDFSGCTALSLASRSGHLGVVQQLVRHTGGRGLNEGNNEGYTALRWACGRGHVEVARILLLAGADHTIAGNDRVTPRQAAKRYNNFACVQLFEVSARALIADRETRWATG